MKNYTHAFIGVKWCGCVVAGQVDESDTDPHEVQKWNEQMRADGYTVKRVPIEEAKLRACPHKNPADYIGSLNSELEKTRLTLGELAMMVLQNQSGEAVLLAKQLKIEFPNGAPVAIVGDKNPGWES